MISDENILRFLYILFFIFFTAFNHILANCEKIKNKLFLVVLVVCHTSRKKLFYKFLLFSILCCFATSCLNEHELFIPEEVSIYPCM